MTNDKTKRTQDAQDETTKPEQKKPVCGIVMPISSIEDCSARHWEEVKNILIDAISSAEYEANLVSDADDSGVIQKRIIQNLYSNEIVVCDVSCKNPNVMFELGMRLAFDKPTIIVMDNMTDYSFDTASIEHLIYPRDLSYYQIVDFKEKLCGKIIGTMRAAKQPGYTTFLQHFGEFKASAIEHREGSFNEVILEQISDLKDEVQALKQMSARSARVRFEKVQSTNHESPIPNALLYDAVQHAINLFCLIHKIEKSTLKMQAEDSLERQHLYNFVCNDETVTKWGFSPSSIKQAINRALHS